MCQHADVSNGQTSRGYAIAVLVVLTVINFLNYIDRYVLAAVLESVRLDFGLDDSDAGLLGLMFMVVYMIASPFGGWLGDRSRRTYLVAGGVALWSLATAGCAYVRSYEELLLMRALIGIGEAGYATVAPGMIADLFEPRRRGRILAYFYLAIPVGSALGFALGGAIAAHWQQLLSPAMVEWLGLAQTSDPGWRLAFLFAGGPGLVFALLAAVIREPERGGQDEGAARGEAGLDHPWLVIKRLFRSPAFRATTGGMVLMTFTLGGLAHWMPTFLQRAHGYDEGTAGTLFGGILVVSGLTATLLGGRLGDRAFQRAQGGYLRISGWGLIIGTPAALAMALVGTREAVLVLSFVAEFFLLLNTGPLNAALVGCVPANLRASSVAINVFFIHACGDAISPFLMGLVSDGFGPMLAGGVLGATAETAGLRLALSLAAIVPALGGVWLLAGARRIDNHPGGLAGAD